MQNARYRLQISEGVSKDSIVCSDDLTELAKGDKIDHTFRARSYADLGLLFLIVYSILSDLLRDRLFPPIRANFFLQPVGDQLSNRGLKAVEDLVMPGHALRFSTDVLRKLRVKLLVFVFVERALSKWDTEFLFSLLDRCLDREIIQTKELDLVINFHFIYPIDAL